MTTRHCAYPGHEGPRDISSDLFRYGTRICRACDARRRRDERAAAKVQPPDDGELVKINKAMGCWFGPVDRDQPLRSAA